MLRATNREQVRQIRVLVSLPNDIKAERDLLDRVVEDINRNIAEPGSFVFQLFKGRATLSKRHRIVSIASCPTATSYSRDLRTHFGTPTANYGSGTEQEFRAALERFDSEGKPWISFYFYSGPVQLRSREEREQYDKGTRVPR